MRGEFDDGVGGVILSEDGEDLSNDECECEGSLLGDD